MSPLLGVSFLLNLDENDLDNEGVLLSAFYGLSELGSSMPQQAAGARASGHRLLHQCLVKLAGQINHAGATMSVPPMVSIPLSPRGLKRDAVPSLAGAAVPVDSWSRELAMEPAKVPGAKTELSPRGVDGVSLITTASRPSESRAQSGGSALGSPQPLCGRSGSGAEGLRQGGLAAAASALQRTPADGTRLAASSSRAVERQASSSSRGLRGSGSARCGGSSLQQLDSAHTRIPTSPPMSRLGLAYHRWLPLKSNEGYL